MKNKIKKAEKKIDNISATFKRLKEENQDLKFSIELANKTIAEYSKKFKDIEDEKNTYKSRWYESDNVCEDVINENSKLKKEIETLKETIITIAKLK